MSTFNHQYDHQEQICPVQCCYCTTILLVRVPCNSLSMEMTVKCEHCACISILSLNTMKPSVVPLHVIASLNQQNEVQPKQQVFPQELDNDERAVKMHSPSLGFSSEEEEEENISVPINQVINKPPEKRQRAPSAYNCFIKDEIRRLKAEYPSMTHKQAFSTAAKNWAHFPQSQYNGVDCYGEGERKMPRYSESEEVHKGGNNFLGAKTPSC
ncbi:Axial regulator YABBY 4 [Abeliophyllum distichum]|uniref:Axial regulator YABBY 4 n=1 Tax=Abeliophyllum distichum TaxID=126358 RepID=A0ABD1R7Y9_9LAMI